MEEDSDFVNLDLNLKRKIALNKLKAKKILNSKRNLSQKQHNMEQNKSNTKLDSLFPAKNCWLDYYEQ